MGGTAGWLEVILFLIGLSCLGLEIFVLPGFGVFGVSGILLVLSSLIMAGHSWSLDTSANLESLTWQMGQVLMAFVVVGVIAISIARVLPSMPGFESMVLGPPGQTESEPQLRLQTSEMNSNLAGARHEIGQRGLSMTILRPAGKARFENELIDVVSEGPFIPAETELQIVSVTGKRIVVRQV